MILAGGSWRDAVADRPLELSIAALGLAVAAIVGGFTIDRVTRRTTSLRQLVVVIAVSSLVLGAIAAIALAQLMVFDSGEARSIVGVLAVTTVFASILAIVGSASLGNDAQQVEHALRRLESGDRAARTDVERADELGHVARALDELSARLDAIDRQRDALEHERRTMLSNVGHDLRTPLTALRAAIEALQDGIAPDQPRYLRAMAHDVNALSGLVDDLFLLSRIEAGRVDLTRTRIDLREIADEAVEAITPAAAARDVAIELRCRDQARVDANAGALGRVLRNLLDNAIRHAPVASTVTVAIDAAPQLTVRVIDQGPGFEADFESKAFERFSRADASRNRSSGGGGLGLAIARGLVEAHGGRIWIEPPPGGTVAFELPSH